MARTRISNPFWCAVLGLGACLPCSCGVDDRQLSGVSWTPDSATGGRSTINGTGGERCNTDAGFAKGGAVGAESTCSGGQLCPDLNENNVPDDAESLAEDSTFNDSTEGWIFELGVGFAWNKDDACGRVSSGSISVTNQFAGTGSADALSGARQCVTGIASNRIYALVAEAKPTEPAFAAVGLAFYSSTDCSDEKPLKQYNSTAAESDGGWRKLSVSGASPETSRSVAVRLLIGATNALPVKAVANGLFDNVLVLSL